MGEDNLGIELINKDATINALIPILAESSVNPYTQDRIIGCILNQPTAYDVEKVVAELEELANYNGNAYLDSADVIDIVRKGGAS